VPSLTFSFHNLLGLAVETNDRDVRGFYSAEYEFHAGVLPDGRPLVRLRWGDRGPGLRPHQHKVLARWRSSLRFGDREVVIDAEGNRLAIPMVHHMLVHPSLRLLASHEGWLLLHAASVACGGRSLILTGAGGAGKTTVSGLLLAAGGPGWEVHGDDYIFLGPGRKTFAYVTRSHLYRSLTAWVPEVRARLTAGERLRLEVWGRLREWSGERVRWPVRVAPERLWPGSKICPEAELAAIVLLGKGASDHPALTLAGRDPAIFDRLQEMNFAEARHFIRFAWEGEPEATRLQQWRSEERESLRRLSDGVPLYRLELPALRGPRPEMAARIVELLQPLLSPGP
jgi:hypothetical protein